MSVTKEPAVIAILHDVARLATLLERQGKRNLKEAKVARDMHDALLVKFRAIDKRINADGREQ
jgi:hypothetical protein